MPSPAATPSDPRFTFGAGKFGDLAGFASALILAMIALLIGVEAVSRLLAPVTIHFAEAIPIAVVGLAVNIASAWLLSGGDHHHGHAHEHAGQRPRPRRNRSGSRPRMARRLEVFEDGVPPRFRVRAEGGPAPPAGSVSVETVRPDGARQAFAFVDRGMFSSRSRKFASRMNLPPMSRSGAGALPPPSRSTSTRMGRRPATTTCARRSSMSWATPPCR